MLAEPDDQLERLRSLEIDRDQLSIDDLDTAAWTPTGMSVTRSIRLRVLDLLV